MLVVPEAEHEASQGPLKGTMSDQKALQGFETESRKLQGGMEESATFHHLHFPHGLLVEKKKTVWDKRTALVT